jgi:hypothetical protein
MKQTANSHVANLFWGKSQSLGKAHGVKGDPIAVGLGIPVFFSKGLRYFAQRIQLLFTSPFPARQTLVSSIPNRLRVNQRVLNTTSMYKRRGLCFQFAEMNDYQFGHKERASGG